jgi:hypothetical protein
VTFHPDSCGSAMGEKSYNDLSDTINRLLDVAHHNQHALHDLGHTVAHGAYSDAIGLASLAAVPPSAFPYRAPLARAAAPRPPHSAAALAPRRPAGVTSLEAAAPAPAPEPAAPANPTANATARADGPKGGFPMAEGILQVRPRARAHGGSGGGGWSWWVEGSRPAARPEKERGSTAVVGVSGGGGGGGGGGGAPLVDR